MSISPRLPWPLHRAVRYAAAAAGVAAAITIAAACGGPQASRVSPIPHMSTPIRHESAEMQSSARHMARSRHPYLWVGPVGRR